MYNPKPMKEIQGFLSRNLFQRKETTPQPFRMKYLERLSESDLNELKRKVKKNKGVIQVLVHPFYKEEEASAEIPFDLRPEYKEERDAFIREVLAADIPLIIFEEEQAVPHLLQRQLNSNTGTVYVVSTLPGDGRPASMRGPGFNPYFMNWRVAANLEYNAWSKVMTPLKKTGVKRALVGGQYMVLAKPANKNEERLFGIFNRSAKGNKGAMELVNIGVFPDAYPGKVMESFLKAGIDVSVSTVSSPTNKLQFTPRKASILA